MLEQALTHRSFAYENGGLPTNERLEFLGDSVLGLVVTETLYRSHPDLPEGQLAKLRSAVVNMRALAEVARELGLGQHLRLGKGEEATGGRDKASILADGLEALIGAVYVDRGIDVATAVVHRLFDPLLDRAPPPRRRPRLEDQPAGAHRHARARRSRVPDHRVGPGPREVLRGHGRAARRPARQRAGQLQEGGRAGGRGSDLGVAGGRSGAG